MGMSLDAVADHLASLDGVRERARDALRGWYRQGRLVARMLDERFLVIRSDFPDREELLSSRPGTFYVPPRFERHQMVVADLESGEQGAILQALTAAHILQGR